MGDFGGPQFFDKGARHASTGLAFQPHHFSSFDLFQRPQSFGFSPGTSPAPNDIKNEGSGLFFVPQSRNLPTSHSNLLGPNALQHTSSEKPSSYRPASPQSMQQPSRLRIPSATNKQKYGQLTPPSETNSAKESPAAAASHGSGRLPEETRNGPTTRKRRRTQPSHVSEPPSQSTTTPRRRKKSTRKESFAGSTAEGDDKRSQFLERNRVAASKCRQKKKQWTSNLEQRARELQANKTSLALLVSSLREELLYLKGQALKHTTCDCNSVRDYLARHAETSLPCRHLDNTHSPHSGSNFSFEAMDLDPSIMHGSPSSPAMAKNQDLPELNIVDMIPD
jgi:bZIP transcription factor